MSCTNNPPSSWMKITLTVTVDKLTEGTTYNLYEYSFDQLSGQDEPLVVPAWQFNRNEILATSVTKFVATGQQFVTKFATTSDKVVVFRAVKADYVSERVDDILAN